MKRLLFVIFALLLVIATIFFVKPLQKSDTVVMGMYKKPIIFNIY